MLLREAGQGPGGWASQGLKRRIPKDKILFPEWFKQQPTPLFSVPFDPLFFSSSRPSQNGEIEADYSAKS
jgi:hypothetical protein